MPRLSNTEKLALVKAFHANMTAPATYETNKASPVRSTTTTTKAPTRSSSSTATTTVIATNAAKLGKVKAVWANKTTTPAAAATPTSGQPTIAGGDRRLLTTAEKLARVKSMYPTRTMDPVQEEMEPDEDDRDDDIPLTRVDEKRLTVAPSNDTQQLQQQQVRTERSNLSEAEDKNQVAVEEQPSTATIPTGSYNAAVVIVAVMLAVLACKMIVASITTLSSSSLSSDHVLSQSFASFRMNQEPSLWDRKIHWMAFQSEQLRWNRHHPRVTSIPSS